MVVRTLDAKSMLIAARARSNRGRFHLGAALLSTGLSGEHTLSIGFIGSQHQIGEMRSDLIMHVGS